MATFRDQSRHVNEHKLVKLRFGGKPWREAFAPGNDPDLYFAKELDHALILTDGLQVKASSSYAQPVKSIIEKASKVVGKTLGGAASISNVASAITEGSSGLVSSITEAVALPPNVRYQTSLSELPAWESSSVISFGGSLSFTFHFGMAGEYDGRTEVYNPVIALAGVHLPTKSGDTRLTGPMPSTPYVLGMLAKTVAEAAAGMDVGSLLGGGASDAIYRVESAFDSLYGDLEQGLFNKYSGWPGIVELQVGRVRMPKFYIGSADYKFSTETDSNGFPIQGTVTWSDIKTLEIASKSTESYKLYDDKFNTGTELSSNKTEAELSSSEMPSLYSS